MQQLNEEQKRAVNTLDGPLLVLAGAGSGKTRVVTFRIAHMLESGIPASQILGLTFTNKAALEMKERVHQLSKSSVLICTFHSLGVKILRESIHHFGMTTDFTIYDEEDSLKVLKSCLEELKIDEKTYPAKAFRGLISGAKNQMLLPEDVAHVKPKSSLENYFASVYALYQNKLKSYNAVDFDDLLFLPVRLFRENRSVLEYYQQRFTHLLIDEYQDTNGAQYELALHLVAKSGNIFVVGDPDQSIYSWRGANIGNILNFEKDYPGAKVIKLEENYRSRSNILKAASALIANNQSRYQKELWSNLGEGEKIKYHFASSEREEAHFVVDRIRDYHENEQIPLRQMVVFYRTHAQSRSFEDSFLNRRIPYVIVGGISFYQRREIKDILAFLRIIYSNSDFISFLRTINLPKRGFGEATLEKMRQAASDEGMAIFSYIEAIVKESPLKNSVKLSSKQREGLKQYVDLVLLLRNLKESISLGELVKSLIEESNYLTLLKEDPDSYVDRKENLQALIAKAKEWEATTENPTLGAFLEELSLKTSLDESEGTKDVVNLMTLHNGKGLEFQVAFLVGMEEDLFPHANSRDDEEQLEEERRLCYVGMTRAKEYLYLTSCMQRYIWGTSRSMRPSRFIHEIPQKLIEKVRGQLFRPFEQKARQVQVKFIDDIEEEFLSLGDAVYHATFGVGIIKEISDSSHGKTYKIYFSNDMKERSIVAKYAHLKKL